MKITIQIADTDGPNVSPMDNETKTAPVELDVHLWAEHIHVEESEADESEGDEVTLEALITEFIAMFDSDFDRESVKQEHRMDPIEEHVVLLLRTAREFERLREMLLNAVYRRVEIAAQEARDWDRHVNEQNRNRSAAS
jgi:hypothetical protein